MSTNLLISHRPEMRPVALRLFANLRDRLPHLTITPGIDTVIQDPASPNGDIMQAIIGSEALLVITSPDWYGEWQHDQTDPDHLAIKGALTCKKKVFVLHYDQDEMYVDSMPDAFTNLMLAENMLFSEHSISSVCDVVGNHFGTPELYSQVMGPRYTPESNAVTYEPNPRYPDSDRVIHKALSPTAFQHPLDKAATENLRKVRGFDWLMAKFMEYGVEKIDHMRFAANCIKVSERQYPMLYNMMVEAATILDMPIPDMYVMQYDMVNAFTYGHNSPYIVIYSGLLELMNEDEIMAVIAHELGHIKCSHVLYNQMAQFAAPLTSSMLESIPAFGSIIKKGFDGAIQIAFMTWSRRSELSADRAALLVMQDPEPCISMLAKLAGGTQFLKEELCLESFIEQAQAYDVNESNSNVDRLYRLLLLLDQTTHPFPVERARFLNDWVDSIEFDQILDGNYERRPRAA